MLVFSRISKTGRFLCVSWPSSPVANDFGIAWTKFVVELSYLGTLTEQLQPFL